MALVAVAVADLATPQLPLRGALVGLGAVALVFRNGLQGTFCHLVFLFWWAEVVLGGMEDRLVPGRPGRPGLLPRLGPLFMQGVVVAEKAASTPQFPLVVGVVDLLVTEPRAAEPLL